MPHLFTSRKLVSIAVASALALPLSPHAETFSCEDVFKLSENTQFNRSVYGGLNVQDRQVILGVVSQNGNSLYDLPSEFQQDKEIVLAAVYQNGLAVRYAADSLKGDVDIAATALRNNGLALSYLAVDIKKNKDLVLIAMQQNGCALKFVHRTLLNDRDVVRVAVMQNGSAIDYAVPSMKHDPRLVALADYDKPRNGIAIETTHQVPTLNFNQDIFGAVENALSAHLMVAQANLFVEQAHTREEHARAMNSLKLAETYRKFWKIKLAEAKIRLRKNPNLLKVALPEAKQRNYTANQLLARAEKPKELRMMYAELIMADGNHEQAPLAKMDYAKDSWPQIYPEAEVLRYIEQNSSKYK
ncbi:MAG: DUF4116 domain-containing protein [Gallionellaceae bacterium]